MSRSFPGIYTKNKPHSPSSDLTIKPDGGFLHFHKDLSDAMSECNLPFTDEELDIARQTDLPDLFASLGYQVRTKGSYYTLAEIPHIMIKRRTSYYDNYERAWGDAIIFLRKYHNMEFKEAVRYLLDLNGHSPDHPIQAKLRAAPASMKKSPAVCILPEAHTDHRRVFAYLIKRGIARNVIVDFIRQGFLYESADYHNAIFVWTITLREYRSGP